MKEYTYEKYLEYLEKRKEHNPKQKPFSWNVWKQVNEILDLQREYKRKGLLKKELI